MEKKKEWVKPQLTVIDLNDKNLLPFIIRKTEARRLQEIMKMPHVQLYLQPDDLEIFQFIDEQIEYNLKHE